jgi:hypothetical protein
MTTGEQSIIERQTIKGGGTMTNRTTSRTAAHMKDETAHIVSETVERGESTGEEIGAKLPLSEVRKPLFASVGAADLAVEKLFALPTAYSTEVKKLSDRVVGLPTQAAKVPAQVQIAVRSLPATVGSQLADLQGRATQLYNSFADRGEKRVSSIRRNPATREAVIRTKTAMSQTMAARVSGRRALDAVGRAATEAAQPS